MADAATSPQEVVHGRTSGANGPSSTTTSTTSSSALSSARPLLKRFHRLKATTHRRLTRLHARTPYLHHVPLPSILIIVLLILINLVVWAICALILSLHPSAHLLGTAALAYSLGLRHALDADHISAIDLMTRRLIATGQRPVTVGTWFSLGHSTIVVVTSIVVAATAAGVSKRFDGFGTVGGIIGSGVSAAFLILLGVMNAWILWRLVLQMRKVIAMDVQQANREGFRLEMGGGLLLRVLKRMFRLIDRPWKMYPLGVLFGLGFDTSSEIALLGISSIQGARGTSMWLILVFPVLFTAGMCLVDTADGALMMGLYVAPMGMGGGKKQDEDAAGNEHSEVGNVLQERGSDDAGRPTARDAETGAVVADTDSPPTASDGGGAVNRVKDPLTFLYYSIVLTTLTVICAIVIGIIQLLTLILNVAHPEGTFWDGVEAAGDSYEIIGGAICGSFIVAGVTSVLLYGRFKCWVERKRARLPQTEVPGPPYSDEVSIANTGTGLGRRRRSGEEDGGQVIDETTQVQGKPEKGSRADKTGATVRAREVTEGEGSRVEATRPTRDWNMNESTS